VENKVLFLKKSRLFERATDELVLSCEHYFMQKTFRKGAILFEQGDAAATVYLIKRGRVRIARHTPDGKVVTFSMLGPGDIFGEEVVARRSPRASKIRSCAWPARAICSASSRATRSSR
jgi:CRP-like cAMP-binding protein